MGKIKSINPYNNQLLKEYDELNEEQLESCLHTAEKAFVEWRKVSFSDRAALMKKCGDLLLSKKQEYARLITLEMGKPILQSIAEVEKCASACYYYADHAESFLKDEILESDATRSFASYEPLGCILAIMPWNFPFWQVFRFAAPGVMAGNVGLLKHASNVPQCSLAIESIFREAGFPEGVFQSLLIGSSKVSYLINHSVVKAATLTGSEKAGSEVAMLSGKNIKKTVLELGGSDPFIVLKDADIEKAISVAVGSRMINTGQSCIAAKRFIVEQEMYERFLTGIKAELDKLVAGDPQDEKTDIGPLARVDLAQQLEEQVKTTLKQGATLYYKKENKVGGDAFFMPAILTNVSKGMLAYDHELFGPVATVFLARDEEHALEIANDSPFGLGAAIWTKDIHKAEKLARRVEAGAVFINGLVKSDSRLPFGGVKMSGYGRELSYHGIREFVNCKTIWMKK